MGSMSTIQTHFKQWQTDQAMHIPHTNQEVLSPDITRAINLTIATLVQQATAELSETLAEEQSVSCRLQKEYVQLETEHQMQAKVLAVLETEFAVLTGRTEQMEIEIERTNKNLIDERKTTESLRIELAIASHLVEEIPRFETELNKVRAELLDARTQSALFSEAAEVAKAKYEAELEHRIRA